MRHCACSAPQSTPSSRKALKQIVNASAARLSRRDVRITSQPFSSQYLGGLGAPAQEQEDE